MHRTYIKIILGVLVFGTIPLQLDAGDVVFKNPQSVLIDNLENGLDDFVEGPSIGPDCTEFYYHKLVGKKFRLYKVSRTFSEYSPKK